MKTFIDPETIHPPLAAYSHQVEVSGAARLLFISGQVGMALDGSIPDEPLEQLALAVDNVVANLAAAGMQLDDLVKLTIYLVGEWDANARRKLLASKLGAHRPCTTLLFVAGLASPKLVVELDAWASADV
jgi:enamine deaminase RidA (YjgF/YER057c/UK114 family)